LTIDGHAIVAPSTICSSRMGLDDAFKQPFARRGAQRQRVSAGEKARPFVEARQVGRAEHHAHEKGDAHAEHIISGHGGRLQLRLDEV
jgi:nucleoside-diphosphate-sugar epimerase